MSELPLGWEWAYISDLIGQDGLFVDGDWVESKDQDPVGSVRLTQLADVGDGRWRNRSDRWMNEATSARLGCTFLNAGDVLIARMPDPLGRACIYPGGAAPSVTCVDVAVLRPGAGSVLPAFLVHALNSPRTRNAMEALATGTTRKRISRTNLGRVRLPIPPLAEQSRIVEALDDHLSRLDAAERNLREAGLRLAQARVAALQAAIDGAPGSEIPLADLSWDSGYGTSTKCSYEGTGTAVARIPNIAAGRIDLTDLKYAVDAADLSGYQIKAHDLLVVRTNGSRDLIGRCAAAEEDLPAAFASYLIRFRIDPTRANPQWVSAVLGSRPLRRRIETMAASSAGQYNLNLKNLGALPIPVPSAETQASTLAQLEEGTQGFDRLRHQLVQTQQHAAALRRSLLDAALSGRLATQDPHDEPASVLLKRIAADRALQPTPKRRKTARKEN